MDGHTVDKFLTTLQVDCEENNGLHTMAMLTSFMMGGVKLEASSMAASFAAAAAVAAAAATKTAMPPRRPRKQARPMTCF